MTATSRVQIGSSVHCSDGVCGTVLRIVIDPTASAITHLAVGPRHGGGRLVPFASVTSTTPEIELNCTKAQFDAFAPDQDQTLVADASEAFTRMTPPHSSAAVGALSVFGEIAPVGITRQLPGANAAPLTERFDRVPDGEEQLKPGEQVQATDGPIGRVSGLAAEVATGRISHLLVDTGHLWRTCHLAIPISEVEHIGIAVHVGLTQQQVGDLEKS